MYHENNISNRNQTQIIYKSPIEFEMEVKA